MNTIDYVSRFVIPAAAGLLPPKMDMTGARTMLLAIGLQESRFEYRRQIGGPARGLWQFETGGVRGVLQHNASAPYIRTVLDTLLYDTDVMVSHAAIEHNDVLACAYARLLLWTHPKPIPDDPNAAWEYYLSLWRPGSPHRETWNTLFAQAGRAVIASITVGGAKA